MFMRVNSKCAHQVRPPLSGFRADQAWCPVGGKHLAIRQELSAMDRYRGREWPTVQTDWNSTGKVFRIRTWVDSFEPVAEGDHANPFLNELDLYSASLVTSRMAFAMVTSSHRWFIYPSGSRTSAP